MSLLSKVSPCFNGRRRVPLPRHPFKGFGRTAALRKGLSALTLLGVPIRPQRFDDSRMRLLISRLGDAWVRSRLHRDERGMALALAIAVMLVLTILLTSVI